MDGQLLVMEESGQTRWIHQDPVTKSQRVTNSAGSVISTIDLDPWGGETGRSSNQSLMSHRYTSYERDANGGDEAQARRYQSRWTRFSQPDPTDGSYDLSDPQSFNRYTYVGNDPVNRVDPSGLCTEDAVCIDIHDFDPNWWFTSGGRGGGIIRPRPLRLDPPGVPQNPPGQVFDDSSLGPPPPPPQPLFCLTDFIAAMERAWHRTGNGTNGSEAGFAGIRKVHGKGGSYPTTRDLPFTNQKQDAEGREHLSFPWSGVYQSIWHVHPKGGPPSKDVDVGLANDKKVPVYSFGPDGLYVYKPGATAPTKLREGLDWTKSCDEKPPL